MRPYTRAKFKFPGHRKIHISKKWGFTECNVDEFGNMVAERRLIPDGYGVKYIPNCDPPGQMLGPALMRALVMSPPYSCPPINPTLLLNK